MEIRKPSTTTEVSRKQLLGWGLAIAALAYAGFAGFAESNDSHERDTQYIKTVQQE